MNREQRRNAIVHRLKAEFGYQSVKAYPIFKREGGGAIMYYMIHATDQPGGAYTNGARLSQYGPPVRSAGGQSIGSFRRAEGTRVRTTPGDK